MTARPTGHYAQRNDGLYLQFDRLFHSPIEEIWFTVTNPAEMQSWIGTYTGSPAAGGIRFKMTAEGDDAPWENASVLECAPPHRFHVDAETQGETWRLICHLREAGGMTTLTFGHRLDSATDVSDIGPGWDWYLDRLVAVRAHKALPDWNDYWPQFRQFYRDLHRPKDRRGVAVGAAAPTDS